MLKIHGFSNSKGELCAPFNNPLGFLPQPDLLGYQNQGSGCKPEPAGESPANVCSNRTLTRRGQRYGSERCWAFSSFRSCAKHCLLDIRLGVFSMTMIRYAATAKTIDI